MTDREFQRSPRRTIAELARENAQLREYIDASKEVAEARAAQALQAALDDLRARCSDALKRLQIDSTLNASACPFCDETWPTEGCDRARVLTLAAEHDQRCEKNPIRIERDAARAEVTALRRALIHVADLQLRRRRDLNEVWANHEAANDLSEPFSQQRVDAELERYTDEDRKP